MKKECSEQVERTKSLSEDHSQHIRGTPVRAVWLGQSSERGE